MRRLLAAFRAWRTRRALQHGPHYVDQIAVLKSDTPLALPPIKPLQAVPRKRTRKPKARKVEPFTRTGTK
jgi:hypothetical protein